MENKKEKKEKDSQLDLGLKNSPKNTYYKYKGKYSIWLAGLDTRKYLKDVLVWFVLIFSITFIGSQVYTIVNLENTPSSIPIFNYYIEFAPRLVNSQWIYMIPALGLLSLIVGVIFSSYYYHKERALSKTLLLATILTNLSICVIFFKLISTF